MTLSIDKHYDMIRLAKVGDLKGIQNIMSSHPSYMLFLDHVVLTGATNGHLNICKWGISNGYKNYQEMAENAAIDGHTNILDFVHKSYALNLDRVYYWGYNNKNTVSWLLSKGYKLNILFVLQNYPKLHEEHKEWLSRYHSRVHSVFLPNAERVVFDIKYME